MAHREIPDSSVHCSLLGSPLAISYMGHINRCSPAFLFPPLFHTALRDQCSTMHSNKDIHSFFFFFQLLSKEFILSHHVFKTLHILTLTYLYSQAPPPPPPVVHHGPAKLDHCLFPVLFYFWPCSCHSVCLQCLILPICAL